MIHRRLLAGLVPLVSLAPLAVAACSLDARERVAQGEDKVTSVESTNVKNQAIGNCWLYATAGWAESLHKGATHRDIDISEAYWNYWFWYEQITGGDVGNYSPASSAGTTVDQAGFWGLAAEIIHRYGFMYEGDFIAQADANAGRHATALRAISASLKDGALKAPEARKDLKLVRAELDKAWKLDASVIADLDSVFAVQPTITGRALGATRVHAPEELPVLGSDGTTVVTLADVVGTPVAGKRMSDGARVGPEAWGDRRYKWPNTPEGKIRGRAFLKNVQDILNRRLAVPFIWWTTSTAKNGVYKADAVEPSKLGGLHVSLFVDYEVEDVPGFGTLGVGQRETRPAALEASLDDRAHVTFFRIKNSWGEDPGWSEEERRQYNVSELETMGSKKGHYLAAKPGYNDLEVSFLDRSQEIWGDEESMHMLVQLTLPPNLRF